jgi:hypothetical protein
MFSRLRKLEPGTFFPLVLIVILSSVFVARQVRIARLEAALTRYQSDSNRTIEATLNRNVNFTAADRLPLSDFIDGIRTKYGHMRPLKPIVVLVDPGGLAQAGRTLDSQVEIPAPGGSLPFRDHIRLALAPLGLGATVRDGVVLITSQKAIIDLAGKDD